MRGRKLEYHNPIKKTVKLEKSDDDAIKAAGLTIPQVLRHGLKSCALSGGVRAEVLEKLATDEDHMAEEHEGQAAVHRHRAEEFRGKITVRLLGNVKDSVLKEET